MEKKKEYKYEKKKKTVTGFLPSLLPWRTLQAVPTPASLWFTPWKLLV